MPRAIIAPEEIYHVFNRGVNKQSVFFEDADYVRMLLLVMVLQSVEAFHNINRYIKNFIKRGDFMFSDDIIEKILKNRTVELISFACMPNHFHLIVKELEEGGLSKYLQRIEIAYTKYFNIKYRRSGYLFQGPFQSIHIATNEQLLHLSAYIHKNPVKISAWKNKESEYPWSSYKYYLDDKNNKNGLLALEIVLDQFKNSAEYKDFVATSGVKELDEEILLEDD